jgi:hypothetical protein
MNSVGEKRRLDLGTGPIGQAEKQLGKLVQFERRDKDRGGGTSARAESAEILIFTGVRYERDTSTIPTKPTASGTKRKRG